MRFEPTDAHYWGYDDEVDERAEKLWWLCVSFPDAISVVNSLSCAVAIPPPVIGIDIPGRQIVDEIREDPEILDEVIDVTDDGVYEPPTDRHGGILIFDAVLTAGGQAIPVQLIVHELAHHLEFNRSSHFSGHGKEFQAAVHNLVDQSWSLLRLDEYSEHHWERYRPTGGSRGARTPHGQAENNEG